ncbi:MAG: hypothetical protein EBX40_01460, partial [Gammaproteobacteria bacterium]|nr:hypothetical protein [Gammaproteobacteria bacterium]
MMKKIVIGLISLGLMSSAYADDLWQVFQLASQNAQTIHANASTRDASVDSFRSKFLGFFPQASASATYNDVGYDSGGASANYKNRVYTVQVSQVIFNPNLWNQVLGAKKTAQSAIATYQYQYQQFIQQ